MKSNPKVSIVIPCYNSEKTLKQCLNSVLNQSYKNYEIILVDNNSTDKTKKIIFKFKEKNKRIKYLFEKKIARGAARNFGEKNAKGEIILMTDSDCIVPKNWIQEMIKPIVEENTVAVQGFKEPVLRNYWTENIHNEKQKIINLRLKDKKVGLLDTANFAIKKDILEKVGYSNSDIFRGNDTELEVRMKKKGILLKFISFSVKHFHPDAFKKVVKKYFEGGKGNRKLREMYGTEYFDNLVWINYFVGLKESLFKKTFKYDFVTGVAWRLGGLFK